jgi:hypothetical protein
MLGEIRYRRFANNAIEQCELRENPCRKGRTTICVVGHTFHIGVYRQTVWYFESKEDLDQAIVVRNTILEFAWRTGRTPQTPSCRIAGFRVKNWNLHELQTQQWAEDRCDGAECRYLSRKLDWVVGVLGNRLDQRLLQCGPRVLAKAERDICLAVTSWKETCIEHSSYSTKSACVLCWYNQGRS